MSYRKLRKALLERLKISRQRLHQRAQGLKRMSPMSTEDAVYCLAFKEGLPLDRFLSGEAIDRVRELVRQLPDGQPASPHARARTLVKTRNVNIGGDINIVDPILPEKVVTEARQMAGTVYPILYFFENSVREVIKRVLDENIGADWWESIAPNPVKKKVQDRLSKEAAEAWHGKRGAHHIYYTDIEDLISVVRVEKAWKVLEPIFDRQDWFSNLVRCIATSRNVAAHMNPVGSEDVTRLRVNFRDWEKQIRAKQNLIIKNDSPGDD
jgi:HEPN superfamily Swt1-like protein